MFNWQIIGFLTNYADERREPACADLTTAQSGSLSRESRCERTRNASASRWTPGDSPDGNAVVSLWIIAICHSLLVVL